MPAGSAAATNRRALQSEYYVRTKLSYRVLRASAQFNAAEIRVWTTKTTIQRHCAAFAHANRAKSTWRVGQANFSIISTRILGLQSRERPCYPCASCRCEAPPAGACSAHRWYCETGLHDMKTQIVQTLQSGGCFTLYRKSPLVGNVNCRINRHCEVNCCLSSSA